MIKINYDRENLVLKMRGHANLAEPGKDIICSAASILAYTLAQNVKYLEKGGVAKDVNVILEEGNALISCRPVEEKETLLCVYDTVTTGFMLLSATYPGYVEFCEKKAERGLENENSNDI